MTDRERLERLFHRHGCTDFRWIQPEDVVISQWVRMKCLFGCDDYGKRITCPPGVPSIPECERFFSEYNRAALFHFAGNFEKPEDRHKWTKGINGRLFELEREVFLSGYHKTLVIYIDPCNICGGCNPPGGDCTYPRRARPSLEALGVDVFTTVRRYDYDISVLADYGERMNRFGMLLID